MKCIEKLKFQTMKRESLYYNWLQNGIADNKKGINSGCQFSLSSRETCINCPQTALFTLSHKNVILWDCHISMLLNYTVSQLSFSIIVG